MDSIRTPRTNGGSAQIAAADNTAAGHIQQALLRLDLMGTVIHLSGCTQRILHRPQQPGTGLLSMVAAAIPFNGDILADRGITFPEVHFTIPG